MISIIIPTITGREEHLAKCQEAYLSRSPHDTEIIVIKDEPSCGHAWQKGWEASQGDFVHFTADDLAPMTPRWWSRSVKLLKAGIIPAAMVYDSKGNSLLCGSPLGDLGQQPNVLVPFLTRELLEEGEWLLPIHYGSDDWVSYLACLKGLPLRREITYRFTHYIAQEGRNYLRRHGDVEKLVAAMREKGYVPPVYEQLEVNLRTSETGLDNVRINQLETRVRKQLREQAPR